VAHRKKSSKLAAPKMSVRMKKVLPAAALAVSITAETALPVKHSDALGPQPKPHIELNVTVPSANMDSAAVSASGGGLPTGVTINQVS
jgi:hypothetical protein